MIVGIDFSGNVNTTNNRENKYEDIIPIFEKFRQKRLGISINLGEKQNYQFVPLNLSVPDRDSNGCF